MITKEQAIAANNTVAQYLAQTEPTTRRIYCGYFGCDIAQIQATTYTNLVFEGGWGDWTTESGREWMMNKAHGDITEAKRLGIEAAVLTVDYCVYNKGSPYTFVGHDEAARRLKIFFDKLNSTGILGMVKCLYPVDEPELNGLSDNAIAQANAVCLQVASSYPALAGVVLGVTYTDRQQYVGLSHYRPGWVGVDSYDHGTSILQPGGLVDRLRALLSSDQRLTLFPGGSNPWRQDPVPFTEYAKAHDDVAAVIAFMWMNNGGIGTNGMAPAYQTAFLPLKGQS